VVVSSALAADITNRPTNERKPQAAERTEDDGDHAGRDQHRRQGLRHASGGTGGSQRAAGQPPKRRAKHAAAVQRILRR
jgi:hypothetical protein